MILRAIESLTTSGWQPRKNDIAPDGMMYTQMMLAKYDRDHGGAPHLEQRARFHIGEFATDPAQREDNVVSLLGANYSEVFTQHLRNISDEYAHPIRKVIKHVNTIVQDMSFYGSPTGLPKLREQITEMDPTYDKEQIAIVSGSIRGAIRLINYTLKRSIPPNTDGKGNDNFHFFNPFNPSKHPDWREKAVELWQEAKAQIESQSDSHYINLLVEDTTLLPDSVRMDIINLLKNRQQRLVVTELVRSSSEKSLSLDPEVGGRFITVDASPLAKATAITAVRGDKTFTSILQTYHTRVFGPPPTTQENLRLLLADPEFRDKIKALPDDVIDHLPTPAHKFLSVYLKLQKALANAIDNGGDGQTYFTQAKNLILPYHAALEKDYQSRFSAILPDNEVIAINGGARATLTESVFAQIEYMKKHHNVDIDTVVVVCPGWTYKDIRHVIEAARYYGNQTELKIEVVTDGFNEKGNINFEAVEKMMFQLHEQGRPFIFIPPPSGPNNPFGIVIAYSEKENLYGLAAKYHAPVHDDPAYIECVPPSDRHTYMQIHQKADSKVPSISTGMTISKGILGAPSGRTGFVFSPQDEIIETARGRRTLREDGRNLVSTLISHCIVHDTEEVLRKENRLWQDIAARREAAFKALKKYGIKRDSIPPSKHYYLSVPLFDKTDNIIAIKNALVEKYGISFTPLLELSGLNLSELSPDEIKEYPLYGWIRLALGGNLPIDEDTQLPKYELITEQLTFLLEKIDELREKPRGEVVV